MRKMLHRMIGGLAVLLLLSAPCQNEDALQKIPLRVVKHGDNVTLTCPISGVATGFYLHKIKLGYMPQIIAAGYEKVLVQGQFNTSRFTATKEGTEYRFMIRNVSQEDEATYLCQAGTAYQLSFTNGTVLIVNDYKGPKSLHVKQSQSVHLGESVSFQCSVHSKNAENGDACPAEHKVFWFRAGSGESHPNIIYTTPNRSSHEEEGGRCFYTLTKTVNVADAGTYYCAVDACGQIIFGGGSTVQPRDGVFQFVAVIGILSVCCVMLLAALIISKCKNPFYQCSKGGATVLATDEHYTSADHHRENGGISETNYVILDFLSSNTQRQAANMELHQTCIYSGIQG